MDQVLPKLQGVICCIDDIAVTGRNDEEHLAHLEAVFEHLQQYGFRIKESKCFFLQDSIEYPVRVISKEGMQNLKRKIEAVKNVKPPNNQTELRYFLRMVNHYNLQILHLKQLPSCVSPDIIHWLIVCPGGWGWGWGLVNLAPSSE